MFAFYTSDSDDFSYFDIGAIDQTAALDYSNLYMQPIISGTNTWTQYVTGIQFETDSYATTSM